MFTTWKKLAALALVTGFAYSLDAQAQYRRPVGAAAGYNPYTGGSAAAVRGRYGEAAGGYNPYTGNEVAAARGYNPATGNRGEVAGGYNPYTGGAAVAGRGYNAETGTAYRGSASYNPYTGTASGHYTSHQRGGGTTFSQGSYNPYLGVGEHSSTTISGEKHP